MVDRVLAPHKTPEKPTSVHYHENMPMMPARLNRIVVWLLAFVVLGLSAAPLNAKNTRSKKVHLHGTLIDMTCWNTRQGDTATFLREHSKACLQMPDCVHSGYAIVTQDGKVYKMDAASNDAATKWIAATQHDADWRVDVKGRVTDGLLDVKKIRLQN